MIKVYNLAEAIHLFKKRFSISRFGDIPRWQKSLISLQDLEIAQSILDKSIVEASIHKSLDKIG